MQQQWQKLVLGIDAAWTARQPSGVSLAGYDGKRWHCLAVAHGYSHFINYSDQNTPDWNAAPSAGLPVFADLLCAVLKLAGGASPDVIAVDMPLSKQAITGRRVADNAISQEFGGRGCSVHTPSSERPGSIADNLRRDCEDSGFLLATTSGPLSSKALIEVYPHTAILELLKLDYRHPYKVSNSSRYWSGTDLEERKARLIESLQAVLDGLGKCLSNINITLPDPTEVPSLNYLKRFEDAIDALVCSWTAIRFIEGRCNAFGDDTAAIWTPVE